MPLMKNEVFLRIAGPLLVGLLIVAVWELGCRLWAVPVYIFPKPTDVAASLVDQAPVLFAALWTTLRITLIAFLCAVVAGVLLAVLFVQSRFLEISLFPYAVLLQVTPIAAISPLIIILVKNTEAALILCASIVALFPIISNTTLGLKSVDQGLSLIHISEPTRPY